MPRGELLRWEQQRVSVRRWDLQRRNRAEPGRGMRGMRQVWFILMRLTRLTRLMRLGELQGHLCVGDRVDWMRRVSAGVGGCRGLRRQRLFFVCAWLVCLGQRLGGFGVGQRLGDVFSKLQPGDVQRHHRGVGVFGVRRGYLRRCGGRFCLPRLRGWARLCFFFDW